MGLLVSHPRAAGARTVLRPALVALSALSLITCAEDPIGPASGEARLRVVPVFPANARVAPLAIDRARILVQRVVNSEEIGETVVDDTIPFALDRDQLTIRDIRLRMTEPTEDFQVTIELLANNTLLFQGSQIMIAIRGRASDPTEVDLVYTGPGANVASLQLAPRDTTLDLGATFSFRLDAFDGQGFPVPQYYVNWSLVDAPPLGARINAAGTVTTPSARDTFYVKVVNIPTGVMDSTRVIVAPAAAPPPITVIPTPLAAGDQHTCEIRTAGSYCWGGNFLGELGDGTNTDRLVPTRVAGGETFVAVSAGNSHTCALTAQGQAFCWGDNSTGALGDGSNTNRNTPTAVAGSFRFAQIAAANQFTCAITLQGQGLCWGANFDGQLGDGTTTDRTTPTAVAGTHLFTRISAAGMFDTSSDHACAIDAAGQAWCWGVNNQGQLGTGNQTDSPIPVAVTGGLTFAEISLGNESSCAITTAGTGFCWGFNFGAQLTAPTPVAGGFTYSALDMGGNHVCGRTATGWVCGGDGGAGQLGDGTSTDHQTPVAPSGGHNFTVMAAGSLHTCGVTTGGSFCWGSNNGGQLGTGDVTRTGQPTPVLVVGAPASFAIVSGNNQTAPSLSAVANPLVVRVADGTGGGIPGVEVIFTVAAGGGTLDGLPSVTLLTNASGNASAFDWTMGPTPGPNQVTATVSAGGVTGNPVGFTATGTGGTTATFTWTGGISTDWSVAGNWSPAQVPSPTDSVVIGTAASGRQPSLSTTTIVGAVSIIAGGNLAINGQGLGITRGLSTGGTGVLTMTNAADVVSVSGDAVFDGGNELDLLSAGGLSVGGNLTQRATNSGDSFHPSGSHVTILAGTAPTISFATPGLVPGTSHFQELVWVGGGTLTLSTPVMAHGTLTLTSQTASTFATANGSRLTVGNVTVVPGTPLVFNGVPLTLSQTTVGPLTLFNTTFQGMATNVSQLVVSHPGGGTSFIFSNLVFSTTPVAPNGFYIDVTDVTGPTDGGLTIDLTTPTPASPGGFARANNGAIVNWPAGAPAVITWTGAVSTDWNAAGNWSPARLPTSGDSVVIPNAVTNYPTLTGRAVVGAMFEDGRLTINAGTLEVLRGTSSNTGINRIITLTGPTDSLIVHGNLGTPTSGTGGVVVLGGDVTTGVNFSSLRFVVNGSGAQAITGSGVSNTQIGVTIVDKPGGTVTFGGFLYTGDSIAVLQGTLAGGPTFQLTRGFSAAAGTTVNLTGSLRVGTNVTALGSYSVGTTIFALPSPTVIPIPVLPYTNLTVSGADSGNSTASLTGRTTITGNLLLSGNGGSPQMRLNLNGNTLVVGGSLTTGGLGGAMVGMTNALDSLLVAGNATFSAAVAVNPGNMTAGTFVLGGNFSQTSPFGGAMFQATGTHKTVLTGNNPTVGFTSMGTATNQNRFASLTWTGTGTLSLADSGIVVGNALTTTATGPVAFQGIVTTSPRAQFSSMAASGPVTFNRTRVVAVQTGTPGQIGLGNATFTNMPTTVAQLTIQHPGIPVGALLLPNLTFSTVPTTGFYLSATDNAAVDPNPLVVNLTAPSPATSGGFVQTTGATVNWPLAAFITWTGNVSTAWNVGGNWSSGLVPTATDSVVIPATANLPTLTAAAIVGAVEITGGTVTLAGQTLTVARTFVTSGTGTLTSNTAASLLVVAGNALFGGGNETGLLTDGNLRVAGNFTQGNTGSSFVASGSHTTFFNGTGAQVVTVPNGGAATSRFQNLRVANGIGAVTLSGTTPLLVVNGTLDVASGATLTGATAVTAAAVITGTGSALSLSQLTVPASGLTVAGTYGVNQTILTGGGAVPALTYNNLRLLGPSGYNAAANITTTGGLETQSDFSVGSSTVTVAGSFRTTGAAGLLTMTTPAARLTADSAVFAGGDETGHLTDGVLTVTRALVQLPTSSPSSFVASGNHQVALSGATVTVDFDFLTFNQSPINNLTSSATNTIFTFARVNGNLTANGSNVNATTLNVRGTLTTSPATGLGIDSLILGGPMTPGNGYVAANHYVFDQATGAQTVPQGSANLPYDLGDVTVRSNAILGGPITTIRLAIEGAGNLDLNGGRVTVSGDFVTLGNGVLTSTRPADSLLVNGNATFGGGDETGLLTAGVLRMAGEFVQSNTANSFVASGTHTTFFNGTGAQGVTIANGGAASSRFQNVGVTNATGVVTLSGATPEMVVNGTLNLAGGATLTGATAVTAAAVTAAPGSTLGVFLLTVPASGLTVAGTYGVNQTILTGGGTAPALAYNNLRLTGAAYSLGANTTTAGNLELQSDLLVAGRTLTVGRDFLTTGTGVLTMTNPADLVVVAGSTSFSGGDETGRLTAGILRTSNQFLQEALTSPASFVASGTHTVEIVSQNPVGGVVNLGTPAVSHFQNLRVLFLSTFVSDVVVNGNMEVNFNAAGNLFARRVRVGGAFAKSGTGFFGPSRLTLLGAATVTQETVGPDTLEFLGTAPQTFPASTFPGTVLVANDVTAPNGTVGITADLEILGTGIFRLGTSGNTFNVGGNLRTVGSGRLQMVDPAALLNVAGNASFSGGSTSGLLTDGTLRVSGFTQSAVTSVTSFAPSGNHTTAFVSTSAQALDFGSPGSGAAGSHFQNLDLSGATGGVTLTVNSIADGQLISSGSGRLNGGGSSLTARQFQVTGLIADNTSLILNEQGTGLAQQFNNVTFQNLPATGALALSVTGVGASLAPRILTFNTVNFPTLATGAGNLYAQLTSSNGQGLTLRMLGSNHGIGALGDGPLLSDPANQLTVLGATILWQ